MPYPEDFKNIEVGDTLWPMFSVGNQVSIQLRGTSSGRQWPPNPKANLEQAVTCLCVHQAAPQMLCAMEGRMIRLPESGASVNADPNPTTASGRGLRDWQRVAGEM